MDLFFFGGDFEPSQRNKLVNSGGMAKTVEAHTVCEPQTPGVALKMN